MSKNSHNKQVFVAVTGAQGVGKSTFCKRLKLELEKTIGLPVILLDGLGEKIKEQGIVVGSNATDESVSAIYAAHMLRERTAPPGIVILDRCVVDASAYASEIPDIPLGHRAMYAETSWLMSKRLAYVIHLKKTGVFEPLRVAHETDEFRNAIANLIPRKIQDFGLFSDEICAADVNAVQFVLSRIQRLWEE